MLLPDYWLTLPLKSPDPAARSAFEALWETAIAPGGNHAVAYHLPFPLWQFLCFLADEKGLALHGTPAGDIAVFEPRQSNDRNEFGNQKAVYAAGDGLWPMYFAILDRQKYPMTLVNACIRLADAQGQVLGPYYFFSISETARERQPWRTGWVYVMPADTFMRMPSLAFGPYEVQVPQLASLLPVEPLARLEVRPQDFPFLEQIRSHDDARLGDYAEALTSGGPLPG